MTATVPGTINMPRLGETMESGRVVAWLKRPGEAFKRGEVLLEIETDKTTVEMPALDDGRLIEILAREGAEVAVGDALGRYDTLEGGRTRSVAEAAMERPAALHALTLPRMGETMEEGRVVAWLKQPGDAFRRGEALLEIETDKTAVEVPALEDGRLVAIVAAAGASVAVGQPIGHFERMGDAPEQLSADPAIAGAAVPSDQPVSPPPRAAALPLGDARSFGGPDQRSRATPMARRLARAAGLDIAGIPGTGRRGRVGRQDVERMGSNGPSPSIIRSSTPDVHSVTLPRGRMAYREWTPPVVSKTLLFLHGFGADGATWAGFAAALAHQGHRVIAPDLPGHGATELEGNTLDALVGATATFAEAVGLGGFEVAAHSMGGAVAVLATAGGRLRPARLTLIAPAGLGGEIDADFITGMADVAAAGALAHLLRRLARDVPALSAAELARIAAQTGRGRLRALAGALVGNGRQAVDIVAPLRTLKCPTRIVWGVEDRIIPWTQVSHAPSRTAVHLIADAGHMPHWDKPQDLAALFT